MNESSNPIVAAVLATVAAWLLLHYSAATRASTNAKITGMRTGASAPLGTELASGSVTARRADLATIRDPAIPPLICRRPTVQGPLMGGRRDLAARAGLAPNLTQQGCSVLVVKQRRAERQ